jgi:hypothetical protein
VVEDAVPPAPFALLLFSTDPVLARRAVAAGVDAIVIDWETRGKDVRQAGADTQINHDTVEDLRRMRAAVAAPIVCRINGVGPWTPDEIETAIDGGAAEILVPMIRSRDEVDLALAVAAGRCGVGILIETCEAVRDAALLAQPPLTRVYLGMNDLAIERRSRHIFEAVADGTVERVRAQCRVPFGFGGLTTPDRGTPIPCRLLMGEMARLSCGFSFLRRSFLRDISQLPLETAVARVREGLDRAHRRAADVVDLERREILRTIEGLTGAVAG